MYSHIVTSVVFMSTFGIIEGLVCKGSTGKKVLTKLILIYHIVNRLKYRSQTTGQRSQVTKPQSSSIQVCYLNFSNSLNN